MRNKANFPKSQMFITVISTMNYNEKTTLDTWSKQTQTNPILPATLFGGFIRLSLGESGFKMPDNFVDKCV
jgi:hypothetical protein